MRKREWLVLVLSAAAIGAPGAIAGRLIDDEFGLTPPHLMSVGANEAPLVTRATGPSEDDFAAQESAMRTALNDAISPATAREAAKALARFYAALELYAEASKEIAALDSSLLDVDAVLLKAYADYRLARYDVVLEALADERFAELKEAEIMSAMALARLGAYSVARERLNAAPGAAAAPKSLRSEFSILRAQIALEGGDWALAERALREVSASELSPISAGEFALLRARLALAAGAAPSARSQWLALVASNVEPAASRAALDVLVADWRAGGLSAGAALEATQALSLRWSGGAFEREILEAIAELARDRDAGAAFAALRRLADYHGRSDEAVKAKAEITELLTTLFDREDLSPIDAARLFYENIDYAPPGAEGDALIRQVAGRLVALDLLSNAAELLEHQAFERLRGAERSALAAELGQLYLDDRRASEALRVIRSTRITGLSPEIVARRRLVEAAALDRAGSTPGALALLTGVEGIEALQVRADILWREGAWDEAGEAYRELVRGQTSPFDVKARNNALRAAAAFLKAGDDSSFEAFRQEAQAGLAGSREGDLIDAMAGGGTLEPGLLEAYRGLFGV